MRHGDEWHVHFSIKKGAFFPENDYLRTMKQTLLFLLTLFLLAGCGSKTTHPVASNGDSVASSDTLVSDTAGTGTALTSDETIQKAIAEYLKGSQEAVRFTEAAKNDLYESSWPEVQCSVEGLLDSPASFKDLVVKKVGPGQYKYECVCPEHGDRFIDCCTISASISPEGMVMIEHVKWDDAIE